MSEILSKMCISLHVIVVRFECNLNFVDRFSKKKYSDIKFSENPSSGSRVVRCGRTDSHGEVKGRFW